MFHEHIGLWDLVPDGPPLQTVSSDLLPVRRKGAPAILKIARVAEERRGNRVMAWWDGRGAAPVLGQDDRALLMARAQGEGSLARMARVGDDHQASGILCRAAARLHACEGRPPFKLVQLADWFGPLTCQNGGHDGAIGRAAAAAQELLESEREIVVLHGDLHHGNVLDFGELGWLAIDPKGLLGERTFDFVNILRNPNPLLAVAPERLAQQASLLASQANLDRRRLLQWLLAFSGLSAVWLLEDGDDADFDLAMAAIVTAELGLHQ